MESDIIVEGFNLSESMHGLRYMQFIGDGDSSVHYNIITSVPYGRHVEKIECANHAVKCNHTRLANIVKDNPSFGGSGNLTKDIITKITQAPRKAITAHSCTGDVEALRNDSRNGPKHYFADHSNSNSTMCSKKSTSPSSSARLESLPPGLFHAIEVLVIESSPKLLNSEQNGWRKVFQSCSKWFNGCSTSSTARTRMR